MTVLVLNGGQMRQSLVSLYSCHEGNLQDGLNNLIITSRNRIFVNPADLAGQLIDIWPIKKNIICSSMSAETRIFLHSMRTSRYSRCAEY